MSSFLTFLFIFSSITTWARLQKPEEASHRFLSIKEYYKIKENGQYESVSEFELEILNEAGRKEYGFFRFNYAPYLNELSEIAASTQNKDKVIPVKKSNIEDKPIASHKSGFDNDNQVSVAFPDVQVGSILKLRMKIKSHTLSLPNFFSAIEYFGWRQNSVSKNVYFESEKDLEIKIVDNTNSLILETKKENNKFFANISQKSPIFIHPIEEKDAFVNKQQTPHVEVSFAKSWSEVPLTPLIESYETVIRSELPASWNEFVVKAKALQSNNDKIEYLIEQLQTNIRYLGDWRSVKGALSPRPFSEVATSGYGDCKDFSTALVSLLRAVGIKSYVAWVYRSSDFKNYNFQLPSIKIFNHAIAVVETDSGLQWLDPTNNIVFISSPLPDIADRSALILKVDKPELSYIPAQDYEKNNLDIKIVYSTIKPNYTPVQSTIKLTGVNASEWTGDELSSSIEALQTRILDIISFNPKATKNIKFEPFSLKSRLVRPIEFKFQFEDLSPFFDSNLGKSYLLWEPPSIALISNQIESRFTDINLKFPRKTTLQFVFQNQKIKNSKKLNCTFDSKWLAFERIVTIQKKDTVISDIISYKKQFVESKDFSTQEITSLVGNIRKCITHKMASF